jgi:hypothetical protein
LANAGAAVVDDLQIVRRDTNGDGRTLAEREVHASNAPERRRRQVDRGFDVRDFR